VPAAGEIMAGVGSDLSVDAVLNTVEGLLLSAEPKPGAFEGFRVFPKGLAPALALAPAPAPPLLPPNKDTPCVDPAATPPDIGAEEVVPVGKVDTGGLKIVFEFGEGDGLAGLAGTAVVAVTDRGLGLGAVLEANRDVTPPALLAAVSEAPKSPAGHGTLYLFSTLVTSSCSRPLYLATVAAMVGTFSGAFLL
jgi:hypothetical protein